MQFKRAFKNIDKVMLFAVFTLTVLGLLGISSATQFNIGEYGEVLKQVFFIIIGTGVMLGVTLVNFTSLDENLRNILAVVVYVLTLVALVAVWIPGIGASGGNATRWIRIFGIGIQTSEFAKVALIFVAAVGLSMIEEYINKPLYLIGSLVLIGIPALMIFIQPNLSTAIIVVMVFLVQLFVANLDYRYIIFAVAISVPLFIAFIWYIKDPNQQLLYPHQRKRILAIIYPDEYSQTEAYQTQKSIQAIGSGKVKGKGLYNGILNKASYVPEPHTDFILAVIGEEFGFIGTMIIILCYVVIGYRGFRLVKGMGDMFVKLLVIGTTTLILLQAFINIGVVTGVLPNTGVTLPFVSAGGSSYVASMMALGILLNIDIKKKQGYRF